MIIFLYGPDDYRREQKKKELIAEFRGKRPKLGLGRFDLAGEDGFLKFQNFVRNQSIFEPVRLAVLENGFGAPATDLAAELKPLVKKPDILVVMSEREKLAKAFDFLFKKPLPDKQEDVLIQQFDHLKGAAWKNFIITEAKKRGITLTEEALYILDEAYRDDSWGLTTELQKIRFLGKQVVDRGDLEALNIELAPNFWRLITGLRSQNVRERLVALEALFSAGEPTGKLFNVAAYQLPGKLAVLAGYDAMVKSGKLDYEEALLDLVIN